jgi:hypothetical protein
LQSQAGIAPTKLQNMYSSGRNEMSEKETQTNESRRDFIKKATYTAPVVMTMAAMPSLAAAGSVKPRCNDTGGSTGGTTG